jgi:hypothetical protein
MKTNKDFEMSKVLPVLKVTQTQYEWLKKESERTGQPIASVRRRLIEAAMGHDKWIDGQIEKAFKKELSDKGVYVQDKDARQKLTARLNQLKGE